MRVKYFRFPKGSFNSWELNFIGKVYNLRIAKNQIAFWKNHEPIFNWLFNLPPSYFQ